MRFQTSVNSCWSWHVEFGFRRTAVALIGPATADASAGVEHLFQIWASSYRLLPVWSTTVLLKGVWDRTNLLPLPVKTKQRGTQRICQFVLRIIILRVNITLKRVMPLRLYSV